jgi:hypothetical protein
VWVTARGMVMVLSGVVGCPVVSLVCGLVVSAPVCWEAASWYCSGEGFVGGVSWSTKAVGVASTAKFDSS